MECAGVDGALLDSVSFSFVAGSSPPMTMRCVALRPELAVPVSSIEASRLRERSSMSVDVCVRRGGL